jgi:hypothetical protein
VDSGGEELVHCPQHPGHVPLGGNQSALRLGAAPKSVNSEATYCPTGKRKLLSG